MTGLSSPCSVVSIQKIPLRGRGRAINGDHVLWRVIAAKLREDITAGVYAPGADVPTEHELAAEYDTTRDTVRRALRALENEGLITAGRGRLGRQVRDSRPLTFHAIRSESRARADERATLGTDAWVTDAAEQGYKADQSIMVAIEEAGPVIARWLELQPSDRVVVRLRLRTLDGEPHDLNNTYYPADIAEGTPIAQPADVKQGTITLMREMGYVQVRFADEVTARMPTPDETHRLRIPPGVPVIIQTRTGYTEMRPVKTTVTIWPADRVRLMWEFEG
jgi:GntR family transcriptional regulator